MSFKSMKNSETDDFHPSFLERWENHDSRYFIRNCIRKPVRRLNPDADGGPCGKRLPARHAARRSFRDTMMDY